MIFSSSLFLFAFFPAFFIVFFCLHNHVRLQNAWIILGSLLFYTWGAGQFVLVVLGTLLIDYLLGYLIYKYEKYAKMLVSIGVIMNVAILLYFKYLNFFVDNINAIFSSIGWNPIIFTKITLPLGISFVIFQKMTYCLDIARKNVMPTRNFFHLLEYLLIFPQIIAGPIVKYNEISNQIESRQITQETFLYGFKRFSVGLFKKVWIADVVAKIADSVFTAQAVARVPFDYAWIGIIAYTFQIYFDFSGYSDMAIGMLSMMGFRIGENFNKPYTAVSISDFWKRWHISMTSWFREYLYFPLGGNRKGVFRAYLNRWIVFLVSGFWHGASWNFVFWGAYHGTMMCAESIVLPSVFQGKQKKLPKTFRWACTFFIVMTGWIFFRADTLKSAFAYLVNMYDFGSYYLHISPQFILNINPMEWSIVILAALICFFPLFTKTYHWLQLQAAKHSKFCYAGVFILFVLSSLKVISGAESPFIYFRF